MATDQYPWQQDGEGAENRAVQHAARRRAEGRAEGRDENEGDGKHSWRDKLNGKPLQTMEWSTSVLNVPPSMHRFKSALGLTVGLYLGNEIMKVLTGNGLRGEKITKDSVHPLLQPMHGKLSYNYFSDAAPDRWMRVFQNAAPGILGAVGTLAGSKNFFREREQKFRDPTYLDDYESRAELLQSRPWGKAAAVSSMFSCVSGFGWLPVPNYGLTLGSRFTLASGRKVAFPVIGKAWSDNHSIYPMGSPELVNHMIQYAVNNKSHDPKQLEAMAQGILAGWFRDVTPEQIDAFVQEVHGIRDQFLRDGGIPEELKSEVKQELEAHFKGAGLEMTLEEIGLDPLKAVIGSSGLSGKIAEKAGVGKKVDALRQSYAEAYQARKAEALENAKGSASRSV